MAMVPLQSYPFSGMRGAGSRARARPLVRTSAWIAKFGRGMSPHMSNTTHARTLGDFARNSSRSRKVNEIDWVFSVGVDN